MTTTLLLLALLSADADYEPVGTTDGITIEARAVAGSGTRELRLTLVTKERTLQALCDEAFGDGRYDATEPDLKARRVLAEGPRWRLTYEQLAPAVVSPRDYVVMTRREEQDGTCTVRYQATTEQAPKVPEGFVRIEKLWGSWHFEPAPQGGTRIVYVTFADPAGSIPSFLVAGGHKDTSLAWMRRLIARAKVVDAGVR